MASPSRKDIPIDISWEVTNEKFLLVEGEKESNDILHGLKGNI